MDDFFQTRTTFGKLCGMIGFGLFFWGLINGLPESETPISTVLTFVFIFGFFIFKKPKE